MGCEFSNKIVYLFTNSNDIDKTAVSLLGIGFPVAIPFDCPWRVDGVVVVPEESIGLRGYIRGGLQYIRDHYPGYDVILAEEQVTAEDVLSVCDTLDNSDEAIVLGVRNMKHMKPGFERFAYRLIRGAYNLIQGRRIRDIYTGIRGIPASLTGVFSDMDGDGSGFLLGQMMSLRRLGIPVEQCEVSVQCQGKGVRTPAELLRDLWLVVKLFLKFASSSMAAAGVDYFIYSMALLLLPSGTEFSLFHGGFLVDKIIICSAIARIISSVFNFVINQLLVFKGRGIRMLVRYYVLVITLWLVNTAILKFFTGVAGLNPYISKLIAEAMVYAASFVFQRDFVFKKSRRKVK